MGLIASIFGEGKLDLIKGLNSELHEEIVFLRELEALNKAKVKNISALLENWNAANFNSLEENMNVVRKSIENGGKLISRFKERVKELDASLLQSIHLAKSQKTQMQEIAIHGELEKLNKIRDLEDNYFKEQYDFFIKNRFEVWFVKQHLNEFWSMISRESEVLNAEEKEVREYRKHVENYIVGHRALTQNKSWCTLEELLAPMDDLDIDVRERVRRVLASIRQLFAGEKYILTHKVSSNFQKSEYSHFIPERIERILRNKELFSQESQFRRTPLRVNIATGEHCQNTISFCLNWVYPKRRGRCDVYVDDFLFLLPLSKVLRNEELILVQQGDYAEFKLIYKKEAFNEAMPFRDVLKAMGKILEYIKQCIKLLHSDEGGSIITFERTDYAEYLESDELKWTKPRIGKKNFDPSYNNIKSLKIKEVNELFELRYAESSYMKCYRIDEGLINKPSELVRRLIRNPQEAEAKWILDGKTKRYIPPWVTILSVKAYAIGKYMPYKLLELDKSIIKIDSVTAGKVFDYTENNIKSYPSFIAEQKLGVTNFDDMTLEWWDKLLKKSFNQLLHDYKVLSEELDKKMLLPVLNATIDKQDALLFASSAFQNLILLKNLGDIATIFFPLRVVERPVFEKIFNLAGLNIQPFSFDSMDFIQDDGIGIGRGAVFYLEDNEIKRANSAYDLMAKEKLILTKALSKI